MWATLSCVGCPPTLYLPAVSLYFARRSAHRAVLFVSTYWQLLSAIYNIIIPAVS